MPSKPLEQRDRVSHASALIFRKPPVERLAMIPLEQRAQHGGRTRGSLASRKRQPSILTHGQGSRERVDLCGRRFDGDAEHSIPSARVFRSQLQRLARKRSVVDLAHAINFSRKAGCEAQSSSARRSFSGVIGPSLYVASHAASGPEGPFTTHDDDSLT